jgi:hypothetical protein
VGSLASFGAKSHPGTKHYYGTSENSFVAVVGASALPPAAGLVGADPPPTPDWGERVHIV